MIKYLYFFVSVICYSFITSSQLYSSPSNLIKKDKAEIKRFFHAIKSGDQNKIASLINNSFSVNLRDTDTRGRTALIWAAWKNQTDLIKYLLEKGADPDLSDNDNWTALAVVAGKGNLKAASFLIGYGAGLEAKNLQGFTPLMVAVTNEQKAMVSFLLSKGANPLLANRFGQNALGLAKKLPTDNIAGLITDHILNKKKNKLPDSAKVLSKSIAANRAFDKKLKLLKKTVLSSLPIRKNYSSVSLSSVNKLNRPLIPYLNKKTDRYLKIISIPLSEDIINLRREALTHDQLKIAIRRAKLNNDLEPLRRALFSAIDQAVAEKKYQLVSEFNDQLENLYSSTPARAKFKLKEVVKRSLKFRNKINNWERLNQKLKTRVKNSEKIKIAHKLLTLSFQLGKNNFYTGISLENLAVFYRHARKYDLALKYSIRSNKLNEKLLGKNHPLTLKTKMSQAMIYFELNKLNKARKLGKEATDSLIKVYGEKHPDVILSQINLAGFERSLLNYSSALNILIRARNNSERILGIYHPVTMKIMCRLALLYYGMGDKREAVLMMDQIWNLRRLSIGETHPLTVKAQNDLLEMNQRIVLKQESNKKYTIRK